MVASTAEQSGLYLDKKALTKNSFVYALALV